MQQARSINNNQAAAILPITGSNGTEGAVL
jgi:hypothetical protein